MAEENTGKNGRTGSRGGRKPAWKRQRQRQRDDDDEEEEMILTLKYHLRKLLHK